MTVLANGGGTGDRGAPGITRLVGIAVFAPRASVGVDTLSVAFQIEHVSGGNSPRDIR